VTRNTAKSLRGESPTKSAFTVLWSENVTRACDAPLMTWKFVTMWPWRSQRKPEPVPLGTSSARKLKGSARTAKVVMWTTERHVDSNSAMRAFSPPPRSWRGVISRGTGALGRSRGSATASRRYTR
jgi:hypothetical protein